MLQPFLLLLVVIEIGIFFLQTFDDPKKFWNILPDRDTCSELFFCWYRGEGLFLFNFFLILLLLSICAGFRWLHLIHNLLKLSLYYVCASLRSFNRIKSSVETKTTNRTYYFISVWWLVS